MPNLPISEGVELPLEEIELRVSRSSGPGGQHANVTASRVEAIFDVEASQALSEAQKDADLLAARRARDRRRPGHALPVPQPRAGAGAARAAARGRAEGGAPAREDAADAGVAAAAGGEQEAARREQARAAAAGLRLARRRRASAAAPMNVNGWLGRGGFGPVWRGTVLPNCSLTTLRQEGSCFGVGYRPLGRTVAAAAATRPTLNAGLVVRRRAPAAVRALDLLGRRQGEVVAPRAGDELDADREALRGGAAAHGRGRPAGQAVGRRVAGGVVLAGAVHVPVAAGGIGEDGAEDQVVGPRTRRASRLR